MKKRQGVLLQIRDQLRVIGALIMREMVTRFGREGLGFIWLIAEPLVFCLGVLALWTATKPDYEHGIKLAPFLMTGYMSLILIRHILGMLTSAIRANVGLFYHRSVRPVHVFVARIILEFSGASIAFALAYLLLMFLGEIGPPQNYLILYLGWFLVAWTSVGFAMVMTGVVMHFESFERVVGLIGYLIIPLSGAFYMVAWLPPHVQGYALLIPFVHGTEMIRSGVFGENLPSHYNVYYAIFSGLILVCLGLLLVSSGMKKQDTE